MKLIRSVLVMLVAVVALGAVTSGSAFASGLEWTAGAVPVTKSEEVKISGGKLKIVAGVKLIECTGMTGKGTVGVSGTGELTEVKWTGCKTSEPGCIVKTAGGSYGTIVMAHIPTQLGLRKDSGGLEVAADDIKENSTSKEFMTLQFAAEAGGACKEFPETKIKGQVAGEINNGEEAIEFREPELQGNTFEFFGKAAKMFTTYKQQLTSGLALIVK